MANAAREAGVVPRRIHLVVAIDRLLERLLQAAPGQWVIKGGYANQLRRPDNARFAEDLDLKIDAAIETASQLLASASAAIATDQPSVVTRCTNSDRPKTLRRALGWATRVSPPCGSSTTRTVTGDSHLSTTSLVTTARGR
jgi:hypothetical protein